MPGGLWIGAGGGKRPNFGWSQRGVLKDAGGHGVAPGSGTTDIWFEGIPMYVAGAKLDFDVWFEGAPVLERDAA